MRILHFADVHLDRPFVGVSAEARKHRQASLWRAFERCLAAARARSVDLVTIGGDLWEDESVSENTRAAVAWELGKLEVPVLVVCGNHDPRLPGGNYDQANWLENVHVFPAGKLTERRLGDVSVWGISWQGGTLSSAFLDSVALPEDGRTHLLLLHGTSVASAFADEGAGYCTFDPARVRAAGFALCLAGHIHAASSADGVVYPGSPEPLGWGEQRDHCFAMISAGGGKAEVELEQVNETRYEERPVDCDGAESDAEVRDRIAQSLSDDVETSRLYLRLHLAGEVARGCVIDPAVLAEPYAAQYGALEIRDKTSPAFNYAEIAKRPTADGLFVSDLLARIEAEEDADRRGILELGLRAGMRSLEDVTPLISVGLPTHAD
jgi:exonuclease SbcD